MIIRIKEEFKTEPKYKKLTKREWYIAVEDTGDDLRVINDKDVPAMYPKHAFEIVSTIDSDDWEEITFDDGEVGYAPRQFVDGEFFEKYFDGDLVTALKFWKTVAKQFFKFDLQTYASDEWVIKDASGWVFDDSSDSIEDVNDDKAYNAKQITVLPATPASDAPTAFD